MSSFFKQRKDLAIIIASMVLIILFRYGRVAEDAFFTLRMVFQFLHGHGLVWNVGERVMVSTSPLYLLLSCVLIAITQEYYWSTILLSAIISVSFLLGWWRLCQRKPLYYFLSLLTLTSTIAFRDFMISGFETPLSISLITWLIVAYRSRVSIFPYSLLCSLLALTRFDFVLLIIPMAVLYVWRERSKFCMRAAFHGLCGTIPLWSWLVFSFLYYGTIYPNTYYAKTFALFPPYEQLKKGFIFTIYHLNADPALIFLLISSIIICFKRKFLGAILAAASYIWYVCSIGGDYMIGRMFTPVAVFLLGFIVIARPSLLKYIAPCMLGLSVISVVLPIQTAISYNCIEDERRYRPDKWITLQDKTSVAAKPTAEHKPPNTYSDPAGFTAFLQPDQHFISVLTDPCLARTPTRVDINWAAGHIFRPLPPNYGKAYLSGLPELVAPPLREYYIAIWTIVKEPVFSKHRLQVLMDFYLGKYDHYIQEYTKPSNVDADLLIVTPTQLGDPWNSHVVFNQFGINIKFKQATDRAFTLWLDHNDAYHCFWYRNNKLIAKSISSPHLIASGGFSDRHFKCPNHQEYDKLLLIPDYLDEYGIGKLDFDHN